MPYVTLPISAGGPTLDLAVGVSIPRAQTLQQENRPIPPAVKIRGLIDTGASGTCVDPESLQSLGLSPTGQVPIHTPSTGGTAHVCAQYDVSLVLLHPKINLTIRAMPVISSDLKTQGIQALIGRDVLSRCLFVYDGLSQLFSFAF